ncbi:hypothetical protein AVEN_37817-1 [Araneus ventricosus]|uniref:Tc1-like transposase DDE domain-containing protein n=1 Tax=Araneus ventricosus TaxID=182803 RepID=A0A4Y2P6G3_ARAVE|nr:hypothetical protein AVEN_37817-1 [Araneus ventricosus]
MIPENATLFSIFLLGKGIHEKSPCDVTACRREYLRTAPGSEVVVDRLGARTSLEFYRCASCVSVRDYNTRGPRSSVQQYIRDAFQQQVIVYCGYVEWPPSSPDLNPLDFLLWGYIKQRVYATPPPALQELRNGIMDACASVSPAMLYNVQREVQSRVQMCIVAEGHHFEHGR